VDNNTRPKGADHQVIWDELRNLGDRLTRLEKRAGSWLMLGSLLAGLTSHLGACLGG